MYEELLKGSREGINMTRHELRELDKVVRPLVENGQSPYVIMTNHPELNLSVKTLYNYIDRGVLLTRNIDLKRKTKFKPRKCHKSQITNREVFVGRTYDDFLKLSLTPDEFVEMDTVLSARGSLKCIHTMYFPDTELLLAHLMNRCTPGAVRLVLEQYQKALGGAFEFHSFFPCILTDRGGEFGSPDALETSADGIMRTLIYYCDPMRSNQKGGIEAVHTLIRMVLPKGTVFEPLSQWDVRKIMNHVNSYPREHLGGKTPYDLAAKKYGPEVLGAMQLKRIAPDEVTLTPKLLKK
jgi:IS30 family transposase